MVLVTTNGQVTTRMNTQLSLISKLNPIRTGLVGISREYETGVFCDIMHRDLILELMPPDQFVTSVMTFPWRDTSQLLGVPRIMRYPRSALQDSLVEMIPQDLPRFYHPSHA
jgi:hypothetical protein